MPVTEQFSSDSRRSPAFLPPPPFGYADPMGTTPAGYVWAHIVRVHHAGSLRSALGVETALWSANGSLSSSSSSSSEASA